MTEKYQSKVKAIVRVRPFLSQEVPASCVNMTGPGQLELRNLKFNPPTEAVHYKLDACYDTQSTQAQIFETEIATLLPSLFAGLNTTIFAYGMTGAGKTHTMQGSAKDPGIIPRVAERLLQLIKAREQEERAQLGSLPYHSSWQLAASYAELYNEKVYDLLQPSDQDLPIREDASHNIVVQNVAAVPVPEFQTFQQIYDQGCKNRTTAETKLNASSSRSHAVLILKVTHQEITAPFRTLTGKLHLIDLAGSEDNRRTDNKGVRLTESANINTSLFVLGKVVNALNEGSIRVPYRDSKLTRLLQDSLGGRNYALLIANIAPSQMHYHETFNTLNFASKSRTIVNAPVVNAVVPVFEKPPVVIETAARSRLGEARRVPVQNLDATIEEKVNQKFEELAKKNLLSPFVRKRKVGMTEEDMKRMERIERQLRGGPIDDFARAAGDAATPFTKTATVRELIAKGKALEDVQDYHEAAATYRKAVAVYSMLGVDETETKIATRLTKKIKKLEAMEEAPQSPSVRSFALSSAQPARAPLRDLDDIAPITNTTSVSNNVTAPTSKRTSISPVLSAQPVAPSKKATPALASEIENAPPSSGSARSQKRDRESSVSSPTASALSTEALLDILNSGTLLQLMDLHGVGTKRASLIISRRELKPFLQLDDLVECGFGSSALSTFIKRNTTAAC